MCERDPAFVYSLLGHPGFIYSPLVHSATMGKDDRHRAIAKLLRNSAKHPMQTAAHILQPQIEPLVNKAGITDTEVEASERFPRCLLITDPILPDEIKEYTVQAVAFTITSHDQGWASEDNYEGAFDPLIQALNILKSV